jgi:outer membrane lipoprotein-sorting protein
LSRSALTLLLSTALLPALGGCSFIQRTHTPERRLWTGPLMSATLGDLVGRINDTANRIHSLSATVDIATTVGGEKKGKVTEYQEIRGYILLRKPQDLRMIGLFPVLRNKAFDMVSDGDHFRLSIPTRNKYFVGSKDVVRPSQNSLENLRPQHILEAILVKEIDPADEIAVLESGTEQVHDTKTKREMTQPNYIVDVVKRGPAGTWMLSRKIVFSREDLRVLRQILYDPKGEVATVATYDNFEEYDGIRFPKIIQVDRPQEEYSIQIGVVNGKLRLNDALRDEQFVLNQPEGSQLIDVDKAPEGSTAPPGRR